MRKMILGACLWMMHAGAWAKVVLPDILSDNMVLQQRSEACLWGKAKPNSKVKIYPSWNGETYTVTSSAGGE